MTEHGIPMKPWEVRAILDGRKTMMRQPCLEDVPPRPSDTIHAAHIAGPLRDGPYLDAYCGEARTPENLRGAGVYWCWWTRDNRQCKTFKPARWMIGDTLWVRETWQYYDWTEEDKQWWADRCAEFGDDPELDPIQGVWIAPGTRRGYGATKEQRATPHSGSSAKEAFRWTWESIHGRDAWEENPWVAVTEFERIDRCPKTP